MENVEIYSKRGSRITVSKDLVEQFLKRGFFKDDPTKKKEKNKKGEK